MIPEYVIVHDGVPNDPTARNYWVRYRDYIKNVASCETYSTFCICRTFSPEEPMPRS